MTDPTLSQVTAQVLASLAGARTPRHRELGEALVRHLHAFLAEVDLTEQEWAAGIEFLTRTGQTCTPTRQEFILLSDVLGASMLVDEINHRAGRPVTSSTVTGPFYNADAPSFPLGADITAGAPGMPLLVDATVRATGGAPIVGATVDTWQADANGFYDVQLGESVALRARLQTDNAGRFWFWAVVPSDYPIPSDGPVGDLLQAFGRHPYRPAHVHFRIGAAGYATLTTHVFVPGSPYLSSDAVFGVKPDLIHAIDRHPSGQAPDGRQMDREYATLRYDFVLGTAGA